MDLSREGIISRLREHYGRESLPREGALKVSSDATRDNLNAALAARFRDEGKSVWVRDFHDSWVVYDLEWAVGDTYKSETWKRTYTAAKDGTVTLGDDETAIQVEAVRQVTYRPVRAFLTELNGKTILTAPASVALEQAAATATNRHLLWMRGRFVGAEKANRNGAMWTTGDLEMGEPTVKHGPLNWLHEERHIIGTLTESAMVKPTGVEAAAEGGFGEPYIAAAAAIWKWIWPHEAVVVEQAAEQNKLWYSMECISDFVHCQADDCEGVFPYVDTLKAYAGAPTETEICDHVKYKQAPRRFAEPTFLGGAAIVPPVRPGWADANAELMRTGASLAEKAWDQSGLRSGDMSAGEFERVMASIVAYAKA